LMKMEKKVEAVSCFLKFLRLEPDQGSVLARDAKKRVADLER